MGEEVRQSNGGYENSIYTYIKSVGPLEGMVVGKLLL